jgi:integrase/recombinase XerD
MITQVVFEVVACNRAWYGALEPVVGAFAGYLKRRGYAGVTIENYLQCASHFGPRLTAQRIDLHHLDDTVLHRFLTAHLPVCHCQVPAPRQTFAARSVTCFACCARRESFRRGQRRFPGS